MNRVVALAVLAIVCLGCATAGALVVHVRGLEATAAAHVRLATALLDENVPTDALARALAQPGLHVAIVDPSGTVVVEGSNVRTAPGGSENPPPPPAAGSDGAQAAAGGAPPAGPPRPAGEGPPPVLEPFARFVFSFAHVGPTRIDVGDRTVVVAPDLRLLERWLDWDAFAFVLGTVAVAGAATLRVSSHARGERRALEARAAERGEAAERYQRFLAETGHELRTPLTVMMGYVDILRARNEQGSLDQRILDGMHAETTRMRGLVEKMMTLARLETTASVPRLLDIATAAREAGQTLKRRYPERDVVVVADQSASIVIDADDFSAALGNLLENAVKYAPESPIVIETLVHERSATVSVLDHGPGIGSEDREAIFNRFYRGRGRELGEGLGLGLAIVRRVASRWNGSVECTSGEGRTEFRLTFPLADEERHGVAR